MSPKSQTEKLIKKQISENRKTAQQASNQAIAQEVVEGAKIVDGFRIMDQESEDLLKEILGKR